MSEDKTQILKYWKLLAEDKDLPVLYKLDSKGRKRQWSIRIQENADGSFTIARSVAQNIKFAHAGRLI